jgi:hypothetical protein
MYRTYLRTVDTGKNWSHEQYRYTDRLLPCPGIIPPAPAGSGVKIAGPPPPPPYIAGIAW